MKWLHALALDHNISQLKCKIPHTYCALNSSFYVLFQSKVAENFLHTYDKLGTAGCHSRHGGEGKNENRSHRHRPARGEVE